MCELFSVPYLKKIKTKNQKTIKKPLETVYPVWEISCFQAASESLIRLPENEILPHLATSGTTKGKSTELENGERINNFLK
ncbi:MAG TPA: hypothetical protein DCF33_15445 [Saprospirales bacterium]|nr:hypothetical protein [Saprospirales bacterium]